MNIRIIVGKNLRNNRVKKGWTQEKLSVRSKVDVYHIGKIERGQTNVSVDILEKLAKKLEIPYSDLFLED